MLQNKILFLLSIFIIPFLSFAQEKGFKFIKDPKEFNIKFDENVKKLISIKSDFVQEKHLSFMQDSIISKGIFRYKKQDKIRLEYITPFKYLMVLNNGKIYIKDGAKVNKFDSRSNKLFKQINDMLINTMNGNVLKSKEYKITYFENDNIYLLELQPLDKSIADLIQKIKIYIDKKKLTVLKLRLTEKSGDYTLISFFNTQQNIEIKDEEFVVK